MPCCIVALAMPPSPRLICGETLRANKHACGPEKAISWARAPHLSGDGDGGIDGVGDDKQHGLGARLGARCHEVANLDKMSEPSNQRCARAMAAAHGHRAWSSLRWHARQLVLTMDPLVLKRSSRVMPGLRGTPAGMTTTCIESAQHTHTHVRLVISRVMKKSFGREGQGQGRSIRRDGPTRLRHKCSARETKSDARRHERFRWTCDWPSGKVWWHASLRTGHLRGSPSRPS